MTLKVLLVSISVVILYGEVIHALNKIPTTIRLEDNDGTSNSNDLALKCIFQLDNGRKLRNLEWRGISGENNTTVLSVRGYDEPEIQKDYKNIVTDSGFDIGKKSTTHWLTLSKSAMESVDRFECIVHDDRGRVGFKSFSMKPVVKEKINASQRRPVSGGDSCGGNYTETMGTILSPNYPLNYLDNSDCEWIVTAKPGQIITFNFNFLDLEQCCHCDYLEIRDGSSASDPLIATICFSQDTSVTFRTTGNTGYVRFISDQSATATGFYLNWEAGPSVCGGDLTGSSGIIQSPYYPSNYPDYADCKWTVTVDSSSIVYFELLAFDLEQCCGCDYLQIRDGLTEVDPLLIKFCEPLSNNGIVETNGNTAHVQFVSDISNNASGFQLYWEARPKVPAADIYAFSSSLSSDQSINSNIIVFDSVLYNEPEVYNPSTGIFAPPVHGLYFVSTSCLSTPGFNFRVYIRRNQDEILCKSFASDSESSVGTCTAIEEMFPGDVIRVTGDDNFAGVAEGDGFSGFTGYLIARLDN